MDVSGLCLPVDGAGFRGGLEWVTPRIGEFALCVRGCDRPLVWDEVFGWLHLAARDPCIDRQRLDRLDQTGAGPSPSAVED